jgi:hypothetical protein
LKQGDIVWIDKFPLAQPYDGLYVNGKYAVVINHPQSFGGDVLAIELTTQGNRADRLIEREEKH